MSQIPIGYQSAVIADMNADGEDDFLVSSNAFSVIETHLGLGHGQFQGPGYLSLPNVFCWAPDGRESTCATHPTNVAVTDFNGDGKPDVVWIGTANGIFFQDNGGGFQFQSFIAGGWDDLAGGDFQSGWHWRRRLRGHRFWPPVGSTGQSFGPDIPADFDGPP
jgi:hypothetical protein